MQSSQDITFQYISRAVKAPWAAGEIQIQINSSQRAGRCIYTDPIDTGLGAGRHALSFTLIDELGVDDEPLTSPRILFGDPQVFSQSSYIPAVPEITLGAYLNAETGCFQLGIRLEEPVLPQTVRIAWQAQKEELLSEKEQDVAKAQKFYIANPPKYLRPGMKYTLSCKKSEGLTGKVNWQVIGEDAGTINQYGGYTAPQRQGIFEVQASLEGTDLKACVYVIVKE